MNIIFRVDAAVDIGSGHVMRCLTLAEKFRLFGHKIEFVCRKANGNLFFEIEKRGFCINKLPIIEDTIWEWTSKYWEIDFKQTRALIDSKNVDLIIVDHYSLDEKWEKCIYNYTEKLMVIDDLANRKHYCDILLDHNYYFNATSRYDLLLSNSTMKLLGPDFALLKDDFFDRSSDYNDNIILITFGGSDPTNETLRIIEILSDKFKEKNFKIVVGANNLQKDKIRCLVQRHKNMKYLFNIDNMAEEMRHVNFVIGAGGVSALERIALGIPAIVITVAENQIEIAENLALSNTIKYVGNYDKVENYKILRSIESLINNENGIVNEMRKNCQTIFPSINTTEQVVKIIEEQFK